METVGFHQPHETNVMTCRRTKEHRWLENLEFQTILNFELGDSTKFGLMMKSGMELRRLEDDYKAMVVQTIDITD
jgi:hypothetical protein